MKLSIKFLVALVPTLFAFNSLAQESDQPLPVIPEEQPVVKKAKTTEEIQASFDKRIEAGKDRGSLTKREKDRLERKVDRVEKLEEKFNSDGVVTKKEEKALRKQTIEVSRDIYKEKHDGQDKINNHQHNQADRIKQGVRSGELSKGEARDLKQDQRTIRKMEKVARSDGKVTRQEFKMINRTQKQASKEIYKKKHNRRTASNPKGR